MNSKCVYVIYVKVNDNLISINAQLHDHHHDVNVGPQKDKRMNTRRLKPIGLLENYAAVKGNQKTKAY